MKSSTVLFCLCSAIWILQSALASAASTQPAGIGVLLSPGVVPCTIHVNGLRVPLAAGTMLTAHYEWDFGDPRGKYDRLVGFNAAHVYDRPGAYTIGLTVTDEAGAKQSATVHIVIARNRRRQVYLSPEGVDANQGLSFEAPVRTLAAAVKKMGNESELLIHAGATYDVQAGVLIKGHDIVIDRYGDGPDPILRRIKGNGSSVFAMDKQCDGVTIQHLTFDSPYPADSNGEAPKIGVAGIYPRGRNITVRDCTFLNLDDAINANGEPQGLLVQNCAAPLATGLRGYFVWGQGTDHVYIGNKAANSTREHIVRMTGIQRVLIADNDFANLDRRPRDKGDYSKGTIEAHHSSQVYICNNTVADGTIRVGPLGGAKEDPSSGTEWVVIDGNTFNKTYLPAYAGSHHIMVRNNIFHSDRAAAILIVGPDQWGRINGDITIVNNTDINHSPTGSFLNVEGHADGIVLKNNLFIAPDLKTKSNNTAPVIIAEDDLNSFTQIGHNIWPDLGGPDGRACVVKNDKTGNGFRTQAQWLAMPPVKADIFLNLSADERDLPVRADVPRVPAVAGVFCDHEGHPRPADHLMAGALEWRDNPSTAPLLPSTKP